MRTGLAWSLLFVCAALHAECPDTAAFQSWLRNLDSTDPLIQLPAVFSLPPLADSEIVDAQCIDALLPAQLPGSRKYLMTQLSEMRVATRPFLERAARGLTNTDKTIGFLSAVALSRQGEAAVPTLLAQMLEAPIQGRALLDLKVGSCADGRYEPWALAGLALVRIGPTVVPQILEFVKAAHSYPSEPSTGAKENASRKCRSSLAYVITVVANVDPDALIALYDAVGERFKDQDSRVFLGWLATTRPASVRDLLNRHPQLLSHVALDNFELRSIKVEGLSAAAIPWLLGEASNAKALLNDWAYQSLWLIDPAGRSPAVQEALLQRLAAPSPRDHELPVQLLLSHGMAAIAGAEGRSQLHALLHKPPLRRQIAAWKGLRESREAGSPELQRLVLSGIEQISAGENDGSQFLATLGNAAKSTDSATLSKPLTVSQSQRLNLVLEAANCDLEERSAFAERLVEARAGIVDDSLAVALARRLKNCREQMDDEEGEAPDDTFWSFLYVALDNRDFLNLALRVAQKEPAASRDSLFMCVREALDALTRASPAQDRSSRLEAAVAMAMPDFVAFLQRDLLAPDEWPANPDAAARLLGLHGLVGAEDVQALSRLIEESEDFEERIAALMNLGEPGWKALTHLSRTAPSAARSAMLYRWSFYEPRGTEALSALKVLSADPDDDIRLQALLIAAEVSSDILARALRRRPADLQVFLERLDYPLSVTLEENVARALNSNAALRRTAIALLTNEQLAADEGNPRYLQLAAFLGAEGRRRVRHFLTHACYGLRQVALGSLIRSAQTSGEQRRLLQQMLEGAPFTTEDGVGVPMACSKDDRHDLSTGQDLPFASISELRVTLDNTEIATQTVARQFLSHANAHPSQAASEAMDPLTRWAIDILGGDKSSNSNDQALIEGALRRVLVSGCEECIRNIEPIVARGGYDQRLLTASGLDQLDLRTLNDFQVDQYSLQEIVVTGSRISNTRLPRLEIYPPSDRMQLPDQLTQGWATFGAAWSALGKALDKAGYPRYGLFAVTGGIAVVTALERVNADGSVASGRRRWTPLSERSEVTSLSEYIAALFLGESGQYRLITFVLAPELPTPQSQSALAADTAEVLFLSGQASLPDELAARPFVRNHCYALVYEYERKPGSIKQITPAINSSLQHLQRAGILDAMSQR